MADQLHSFQYGTRRPDTFRQALSFNAMMQEPSMEFLQARESHVRKALGSEYLGEIWDGIMGTADHDTCKTVMPSCIDLTMPVEYMTIIRRVSGVVAAFAYCEIVKELTHGVDLKDDFDVRQAMERAWVTFDERAQEANNVQEGFGCDNSQSWQTLREIGDEPDVKAKMMAIAKLAGRMFESFGYQRTEHPNENPEEVVGATTGNQLDRVLDSELALLADEDTEDAAAMKILQGQATITQMEGKEEKTRGPLVLAVDESGSMHDGDLGAAYGANGRRTGKWQGRNTWAKACCVALVRIAWSENRAARCVHFGNGTVVQELPKDDTRALFEMARSFLSGGTSFGSALKRSRSVVGDLASEGHTGADIMLITDGEDYDTDFHDREIDYMDRDGIKLWTVAIGEDIGSDNPVRKRAERYTYAADRQLGNADTATSLAAGLDKAAMGNDPNELN